MGQDKNILTLLKTELEDQFGGGGVDVFNKLNVRDWGSFFRIGERLSFEHDAFILREGQSGEAVYFLADGVVRVERQIGDDTIELARINAGCIFGELTFLDGAEISANVIADGYVEVVRVASSDLRNLMDEDSRFASHFYHSFAVTLSRRPRATNKIVSKLE